MIEPDLQGALAASTQETLEAMFFAPADWEEPGPADWADAPLTARLEFAGEPSGRLTIRVPHATARAMAADFLGEDESAVEERQSGEVLCELANMICGSALSRTGSQGEFRLSEPRLGAFDGPYCHGAVFHTAATGHGPLEAILEVEPCSSVEG